jgi:hypothetical protein
MTRSTIGLGWRVPSSHARSVRGVVPILTAQAARLHPFFSRRVRSCSTGFIARSFPSGVSFRGPTSAPGVFCERERTGACFSVPVQTCASREGLFFRGV